MFNYLELKKDTSLLWSPVKLARDYVCTQVGLPVCAEEKASTCSFCCH